MCCCRKRQRLTSRKSTFEAAFAGGPYNTLFFLIGTEGTAKIARTSKAVNSWNNSHRMCAKTLTITARCKLARCVPQRYPRIRIMSAKLGWDKYRNLLTPLKIVLSWHSLQALKLLIMEPLSNEEAALFAGLVHLRWLQIAPAPQNPAPARRKFNWKHSHYKVEEIVGASLTVEITLLWSLQHTCHLEHLDCGLQRVACRWGSFPKAVVTWWPKLKFISHFPMRTCKQVRTTITKKW